MQIKRITTPVYIFLYCVILSAQSPQSAQPDSLIVTRPDSLCGFWSADSTAFLGAAYGSFADIFQAIPGGHFFDRGSIGQPAYGLLFAGTSLQTRIIFDGLQLTDPIHGGVDLNWIPVEAVERLELFLSPYRSNAGMEPAAQTLYITSKDLSGEPLRSTVAYRTGGNDYDDIDARFGLQASRRLRINMGGVLKNYSGNLTGLQKYRSQKANITVSRDLGRNWQARYLLLRNRSDLNLPLMQPLPDYPGLNRLHQKEARYDHALIFAKDNTFSTTLQLTDLHRELYNRGITLVNQRQDVTQWLWHGACQRRIAAATIKVGAEQRWSQLKTRDDGDYRRTATGAWGQLAYTISHKWHIIAGLRLQKWDRTDWAWLPFTQLHFQPRPDRRWLLWVESSVTPAGFAHRYSAGPFALGQATIRDQRCDLAGIGINKTVADADLFISLSWGTVKNGILAQIIKDETTPIYRNQPLQQQLAIDLAAEWRLLSWMTLNIKSKGMYFVESQPQNQPHWAAQGYLQLHRRFFKNDLDARVRFGFAHQSAQDASLPYYSQQSPEIVPVGAALAPYLHAVFIIRDVTLFASMQNPLNFNYYLVYPYPMPRGLFRWGFVWKFYN